jgi:hypothetical protein
MFILTLFLKLIAIFFALILSNTTIYKDIGPVVTTRYNGLPVFYKNQVVEGFSNITLGSGLTETEETIVNFNYLFWIILFFILIDFITGLLFDKKYSGIVKLIDNNIFYLLLSIYLIWWTLYLSDIFAVIHFVLIFILFIRAIVGVVYELKIKPRQPINIIFKVFIFVFSAFMLLISGSKVLSLFYT